VIAGAGVCHEGLSQRLGLGIQPAAAIVDPGQGRHVPVEAAGRVQVHRVRRVQRGAQPVGVHAHAHGVRCQIERGQDPRRAHARAQAGQRGRNGRGVVREIVVNGDAARLATHLQAAAHAAEGRQRPRGLAWRDPGLACRGQRSQAVGAVVRAQQRPFDAPLRAGRADDVEGAAIGTRVGHLPVRRLAVACARGVRTRIGLTRRLRRIALDRRPASLRQYGLQLGLASIAHQPAGTRHGAHEMVELALDRGEVVEDIRMVEFEVVQHQGPWTVMHELRAFVEKGGVVLVGLDDERRAAAQPGRDAEALRDAADEKAGIQAGATQDVRQHARRGGLTVGAGHRQDVAMRQDMFAEPPRAGGVAQAAIEHGLDDRVAPRERVADDDPIRRRFELRRIPAGGHLDAGRGELIAHGGVDAGVGAGHAVSAGSGQLRQPAHEGAADAEDMDVHQPPSGAGRTYSPRAALTTA